MIIKNVTLETVCGITSKLPDNSLPEIAFAGKSNVGKSSLINNMVCRKALARTSSEPGKTQTINYYNVNNSLYFVDLPGYGYAKVSKEVQAKWGDMIENYLHTSKHLRTIILLVDIRHEPGVNDKIMFDWITGNGYRPIVVATKCDKLKRSQIDKAFKIVKDTLGLSKEDVAIKFSAQDGTGREELWNVIEKYIDQLPERRDLSSEA